MSPAVGTPVDRVDGRAKVTGAARYAAEFPVAGLAHAALVLSTIPSGRIAAIDAGLASRAEGVRAILTHDNAPRLPYRTPEERAPVDPKAGDQLRVFQDSAVHFAGQPIAVVVADTPEQARHAAALVRVSYEPAPALTEFDAERARPPSPEAAEADRPGETRRGDPDGALSRAPVAVDITCSHPREHHHAIEPHATIAAWQDGRLTLYDKTQWVGNDRKAVALVFGIPEDHVRVVSPYVGGAFGSALRMWPHVIVAALAARHVGRPVRLELTRRQLVSAVGFRPHTEQRVALGAERDGALTAIVHEAVAQTSTYEEYSETTLDAARVTYACPNVRTRYRLVAMHVNSPCPMRAPGMASGVFALETAMDELAVAAAIDPLELRLRNHADRDPDRDLPWSSKALAACYRVAAARFGWERRPPRPRSMRAGPVLIGHGMATAIYSADRSAASASATLFASGEALIRTAASDMGPGTYTMLAQVAADALGLPVDRVQVEIGDTDLPAAPVHGGSITTASVGNAVDAAARALRARALALGAEQSSGGRDSSEGAALVDLLRRRGLDRLEATATAEPGTEREEVSSYAFGAVFAEVRVDEDLGTVRVPRIIGAYDIGRVINPKTARSQCIGGMVGGIGMALLEEAQWDPRLGRVMNANLAEYLVPVNADVIETEALFVPGDDRRSNPLGVKGVAEIALCGVAPAIANAVYHALGKRIRHLPITPERILTA
jgi:xanthine dehydrogenase YagR molybdenum-binding subunit